MPTMSPDDFQKKVKQARNEHFRSSFERAYRCFLDLELDSQDPSYFEKNASLIVEQMRELCWETFTKEEAQFTARMLEGLIDDTLISEKTPRQAISWYLESYPQHMYDLCLSNTQSRRSRAGKEFEDIIELILMGAGIPVDSQGNVGKESFMSKGLGKLVDIVSPGVVQYTENKRDAVLISAKTTLRERWQEVPEEMGRTGAREMFLATLDEKISDEVLNTLYEANIQVTTTRSIKESRYAENSRVLTFEQLVAICKDNFKKWDDYPYKPEQIQQAVVSLDKQIEKHADHDFVKQALSMQQDYYLVRLED